MLLPDFVKKDPWLEPHAPTIVGRLRKYFNKEKTLTGPGHSLSDFSLGHLYYGLHRTEQGWVLREWAPNASVIYLIGPFSEWETSLDYRFTHIERGVWELHLSPEVLKHGDLYKLHMCWNGGGGDRIPAWARRVVQDKETLTFSAQVWDPVRPYMWKNKAPASPGPPIIYEAHPGMATEAYNVGSWEEFRKQVLPRIETAGYNTIQLMAVQEHPFYGSFGYHVSSFFAPSSRFGTPDELKALIDDAHGRGIRVIMDLVHSHAVKNEVEGISRYDGTYHQFFHDGPRGDHKAWDSRCFDYGKHEVLHFLLSNCKYWLEEYHFDGFRFDGVTSMLYLDHGLGSAFSGYDQYYNLNQDEDAIVYLHLANKLIHEVNPGAITIAEEMSGMPGLATPQGLGGYGFDYRLAMGVPDFWIRTIKERKVEFWHVGELFHQLTNRRRDEQVVQYAESHDQALVGDKTVIFWLMDQEMYTSMHTGQQSLVVDNGMALHKMIRLITMATAGHGYLNFMGNEFGHPEWIDFPGAHNNWSYHYARRQWSLADNPELKYRFLGAFDRRMVMLFRDNKLLKKPSIHKYFENIDDQVLVFGRGAYVFVFNFSPFRSYSDYPIMAPPGSYSLVLNTDDEAYGGFGRLDPLVTYASDENAKTTDAASLTLYIPSLSGFVLKKEA
ncbi:MAG: alpha amylase C-terminal domain-containing protein [Bacteroidales bacterium]